MNGMCPVCVEMLSELDIAVIWLGLLDSAIDDGSLVLRSNLNASASYTLRGELAALHDAVLPGLRERAARARDDAQRYYKVGPYKAGD